MSYTHINTQANKHTQANLCNDVLVSHERVSAVAAFVVRCAAIAADQLHTGAHNDGADGRWRTAH
jgi:hypothetical protein